MKTPSHVEAFPLPAASPAAPPWINGTTAAWLGQMIVLAAGVLVASFATDALALTSEGEQRVWACLAGVCAFPMLARAAEARTGGEGIAWLSVGVTQFTLALWGAGHEAFAVGAALLLAAGAAATETWRNRLGQRRLTFLGWGWVGLLAGAGWLWLVK